MKKFKNNNSNQSWTFELAKKMDIKINRQYYVNK